MGVAVSIVELGVALDVEDKYTEGDGRSHSAHSVDETTSLAGLLLQYSKQLTISCSCNNNNIK